MIFFYTLKSLYVCFHEKKTILGVKKKTWKLNLKDSRKSMSKSLVYLCSNFHDISKGSIVFKEKNFFPEHKTNLERNTNDKYLQISN